MSRRVRSVLVPSFLALFAVIVAACSDVASPSQQRMPAAVSIHGVEVDTLDVTAGDDFSFLVDVMDQHGDTIAVPPFVAWTSSDTSVAKITATGELLARRTGLAVIRAAVHSDGKWLVDSVTVRVM